MIRTLVWKEYREQRPVWLAMAALGGVLLVALLQILDPRALGSRIRMEDVLGGIAVVVAFTYGLVCGAMMLAGEKESSTLPFLDYLEGRRARLWTTKVLTGVILTLAESLLLAGLATGLGTGQPKAGFPGGWLVLATVFGLAGFAWGLLGSALSRSVLAAVGAAAVLLVVAVPFGIMIAQLIARRATPDLPVAVVGAAAVTIAALVGSGLIFCGPDWQRRPSAFAPAGKIRRRASSGVRAVLWLTSQQARMGMALLAAGALVLGAIVPVSGLILWPVVTLLLGIGCGTAVFAGEQAGDAQRFLADQRLPIGRIWAVKMSFWLIVAVALTTLTFLAASLRLPAAATLGMRFVEERNMVEQLVGQKPLSQELLRRIGHGTFLTLGLAYGFAFGQFFTLLARKNAVAVVLAVLVGIAVAAVWVPSLVSGGVRPWQVLVVPALLLVSIRPVLWAWAGGRLHTVRPVLVLAGGGALAAAWMAGNFWFRAVAIPDVGEPFDVRAFTASLPTWEQNEAGRLIAKASKALTQYEGEVDAELKPPANPQANAPQLPTRYYQQIDEVLEKGWPKDRPDLARWLERMVEGEWAAIFREAARLPLGMVIDLRNASSFTHDRYEQEWWHAAQLFTARALQLQAQGNRKASLDHLGVVLGLSRQLRHKATGRLYRNGLDTQAIALSGMEHWLRELGPRPELLRSALTELNRHEAQLPPFPDYIKAQYLVALNDRENMTTFVGMRVGAWGSPEAEFFALASKVPWEEQRETRLLRVLAASALRQTDDHPLWEEPRVTDLPAVLRPESLAHRSWVDLPFFTERVYYFGLGSRSVESMRQAEARSLCQLRGTRLAMALALYELEKGRAAATLDALVPRYLPALPVDPYSGQRFHYRVSKGEQIEKEFAGPEGQAITLKVPAGQGVLWSVGPDRVDDGGLRDGSGLEYYRWPAQGLDLIFLVPRWEGEGQQKDTQPGPEGS